MVQNPGVETILISIASGDSKQESRELISKGSHEVMQSEWATRLMNGNSPPARVFTVHGEQKDSGILLGFFCFIPPFGYTAHC